MRVKMFPKYLVRVQLTLILSIAGNLNDHHSQRLTADPSQQRNYAFSYKMTNTLRRTKGKRCELSNAHQTCTVHEYMNII